MSLLSDLTSAIRDGGIESLLRLRSPKLVSSSVFGRGRSPTPPW